MFQRRHYEVIAKTISDVTDASMVDQIALELCNRFAADNPNFNAVRFLTACGYSHGAIRMSGVQ